MALKTIILKVLLGVSVAFCIAFTAGGTFSMGAGGGVTRARMAWYPK